MKLLTLLPVLIVALCGAKTVFGTTCFGPDSPKAALKWADVVFTGEVFGEENDEKEPDKVLYKFMVEKAWKGVDQKEFIVLDWNVRMSGGLKLGQRYIIFASYQGVYGPDPNLRFFYFDKGGKPLPVINDCSFSKSLINPRFEKKILKKLGKPRSAY
jgi:hypothetical protein